MVTQPMSMHLDARMHASNAGLPVEQVSKALPEIGTKNVGRRVEQMLVRPSHSFDVDLLQLLIAERPEHALAALTRAIAERLCDLFATT